MIGSEDGTNLFDKWQHYVNRVGTVFIDIPSAHPWALLDTGAGLAACHSSIVPRTYQAPIRGRSPSDAGSSSITYRGETAACGAGCAPGRERNASRQRPGRAAGNAGTHTAIRCAIACGARLATPPGQLRHMHRRIGRGSAGSVRSMRPAAAHEAAASRHVRAATPCHALPRRSAAA